MEPDLVLKEDGYNRMIDIIKTAGELDEGAPYEKVVTTEFAVKAMETVK